MGPRLGFRQERVMRYLSRAPRPDPESDSFPQNTLMGDLHCVKLRIMMRA